MARRWRPSPPAVRGSALPVALLALVGVTLGCTVEGDPVWPAASGETVPSPAGTSTSTTTTTTSTTTSTTTTTTTSTTPAPTISTTSTTSTSTTSTSTTSTTTTTVAPEVGGFGCRPGGQLPAIWEVRPPSEIPAPDLPFGWTRAVIGKSVQGRDIELLVRPADGSPRATVLVIGGIHGNEPVTPPAVRGLIEAVFDTDVEVWLVPVANPDGSAAGLRCNANGVDLNRNFSWEWRRGDGGPAPFSEPETQALRNLVEQVAPDVVVWIHQPLGYVSAIGTTSSALEQAWASAAGLPVRPDVTQHGGGESWSTLVAGVPAMLVEIDGWSATQEIVAAQRAAFEAMVRAL